MLCRYCGRSGTTITQLSRLWLWQSDWVSHAQSCAIHISIKRAKRFARLFETFMVILCVLSGRHRAHTISNRFASCDSHKVAKNETCLGAILESVMGWTQAGANLQRSYASTRIMKARSSIFRFLTPPQRGTISTLVISRLERCPAQFSGCLQKRVRPFKTRVHVSLTLLLRSAQLYLHIRQYPTWSTTSVLLVTTA